MQYGTDYDLNVRNTLDPKERVATITLHKDMSYLNWNIWYHTVLKPELLKMNVRALNINRSTGRRKLLSSLKYGLDKSGNLNRIIGINTYSL